MLTQTQLDAAVREAYEHAHAYCNYAPTDRSFPVGEDGKMDCTGLILRSMWNVGLVNEPLNCDQIDSLMSKFGFTKTTNFEDVYKYHGFVQWVLPQWVNSEHVHHTYYSLGGDGRTISKYDTGSQERLRTTQPYRNVQADEWGGKYVFKHMWFLKKKENQGVCIKVGDD